MPIPLRRNGSYDDMVRSVIESGELECDPKNIVISYVINGWGKIHPTFINNDRHVFLYMLDVAADGSRPLLRINIVPGSSIIPPPQPIIDEHNSFEDESLDAHPMDSDDHSMELEDLIFFEEAGEETGQGALPLRTPVYRPFFTDDCRAAQHGARGDDHPPNHPFSLGGANWFSAAAPSWGWQSFMPCYEFNDPKKGFLIQEYCIVQADVSVVDIRYYDKTNEYVDMGQMTALAIDDIIRSQYVGHQALVALRTQDPAGGADLSTPKSNPAYGRLLGALKIEDSWFWAIN
ncbi:hypothetical protein FXO37_05010 [Capsicum annuum]|nr:hypothetical protein FXO37_05010 [Capsicum annuum]